MVLCELEMKRSVKLPFGTLLHRGTLLDRSLNHCDNHFPHGGHDEGSSHEQNRKEGGGVRWLLWLGTV